MAVSKAVRVVPELKAKIENGSINLSSARRIAPVLTRENQTEWFTKASTLSQRALEKEITKIRPQAATPEKAKYTSPDRVKLELGLSERTMLRFRKLQDLVSQKLQNLGISNTLFSLPHSGFLLHRRLHFTT